MDKVIVTVIGIQKDILGEENRIELVSIGKHYYKNDVHYILYNDGEDSGLEETSTLLKVEKANVTLIRKGSVMQEQYFAESSESQSVYKTPYGKFNLSVLTRKLDISYGSISGNIDIVYDLSIEDQWQSDNRLHIKICAQQSDIGQMH